MLAVICTKTLAVKRLQYVLIADGKTSVVNRQGLGDHNKLLTDEACTRSDLLNNMPSRMVCSRQGCRLHEVFLIYIYIYERS